MLSSSDRLNFIKVIYNLKFFSNHNHESPNNGRHEERYFDSNPESDKDKPKGKHTESYSGG